MIELKNVFVLAPNKASVEIETTIHAGIQFCRPTLILLLMSNLASNFKSALTTTPSLTVDPHLRVLALSLFVFLATCPAWSQEQGMAPSPAMAVYLPDYRVKAGDEPRLLGATHLILFSAKANEDGAVDFSRIKPELLAFAEKARARNPIAVTVCVGGWGKSNHFAAAVSSGATRERFVNDLVAFCLKHDLGGVDIDWEFPKGDREDSDFEAFIKLLSARLHADERILTIALGYTRPLSAECWRHIDQVNLMSYQPWSVQPYEPWLEDSIKRFLAAGLPPEKLLLGVGFFAKEKAGKRRAISWRSLADGKLDGLPESESGFWPVGPEVCDLRLRLMKQYRLGGIMIWEYGHDSARPEASLLLRLSKGLGLMPASDARQGISAPAAEASKVSKP